MFVCGVRGHGNSSDVESEDDEDPETMLMVRLIFYPTFFAPFENIIKR